MTARSPSRADLARTQIQLDRLPARSVVIDERGDAWQCDGVGRVGMFWYRAFDGDGISSFELAQRAGNVTVYAALNAEVSGA